MDTAQSAVEATSSVAPEEMVSVRISDLAMITRAARLLAAVFEGEVAPDAIVDEAAEEGLTVDADAPEGAAEDEVDTYVTLAPAFLTALDTAEDLAGILPEQSDH